MSQLLETDTYEDDRLLLTLKDRQLRTLFETTLDAIAVADDEGRYLDVNPAACELFGLDRDELLGLSIVDFAEPGFDFRAEWEEFQQQEKMRGEFRLVRPDGKRRVVEYAATANFLPHRHLSVMRDITDRKRAEEQVYELTEQLGGRVSESLQELRKTQAQLQESQERLDNILNSVEEVVWSIHPLTFETIYINPPVEKIFGYSVADFVANPHLWSEVVHPEDKHVITDAFASLSRHRKTTAEYRIIRKDGQVRHLSVKSYLILDETGKPIRIDGTTTDITDRLDAKNLLEKTVRHVPGAIYQLRQRPDGTFHFPYASAGLKATCGVSPEEVQEDATKAFAFIHEEDRDRVMQAVMESAANLTPWYCEYRTCLLRSGRVIWVLGHSTPQREADGSTVWYGYIREITDKKQAQNQLRQQEEKYRAIVQQAAVGIKQADLSGRLLQVNPGFCQLLGYTKTELLALNLQDITHPDDQARSLECLHQLYAGEIAALNLEKRFLHKDGSTVWASIALSLLRDGDSQPISDLGIIQDISDRKRTELALAESEAQNRAILQAIPDIIFRISRDGIYLSYTGSAELLGFQDGEESIGKNMAEYLSPDLYQRQRDYMELALETRQIQIYEHEVTIAGRVQQEEVRVVPLENREEVLFMIRDISDRSQAKAALAESEAQNRAILQAIPDIMFRVNKAGIYLAYATSTEFLDLSNPQSIGKPMADDLSPEHYQRHMSHLATALETRQTQIYEQEVTIEGHVQYEEVRVIPLDDREEVLFMIRDICDRKRAEADRKRQEQSFRLIVEGTAAKIGEEFFRSCVQYLAQVLDVRYAFIAEFADAAKTIATTRAFWAGDDFSNNFIYGILGSPTEYSLGQFCLYPNAVQSLFPEDIDLVTLGVESYAGLPIIDNQGNALGLLVVMDTKPMVQDIETQSAILKIFATRAGAEIERLQAEGAVRRSELQLRQQSRELEKTLKKLQSTQTQLIQAEKMSGLGQLVAGIAHEINNPVGFIIGNLKPATDYASKLTELIHLYQTHYPSPPAVISDFQEDIDLEYIVSDFSSLLKSIKTGATRIEDIVKSLRTFSRLDETGLKAIDLHESIDSTLAVLQSRLNGRAGNPEVRLTKNYDDLPPVEAHGSLLNQVFMNLMVNALDAIEQQRENLEPPQRSTYQSRITITTSTVSNNQVLISIQDNGCGMSPEVEEKIFNPFFTTKPVGKGTGMGLATSYQIIEEQHQGRISVNSTPGEGTEFILVLPIKK